ncbi:hypothetical protein NKH14_06875 [Mesorhizobium sp. M1380]|uniref:hypothetical protein n=1 Tax=Mesorhizobium sp. M1380 TaxID=2957093 RepID=UPI003339502B
MAIRVPGEIVAGTALWARLLAEELTVGFVHSALRRDVLELLELTFHHRGGEPGFAHLPA